MADLEQLRALPNLHRAWRWIRSSQDATYKAYSRTLYRNFSIADGALITDLADRLRRGVYQPKEACKLFFPKPSGILRPYSLLTVEDQIVYQAAVNLVAERLFPKVRHRYNLQVFGHLYAGKNSPWFYRKWSDGYKAFNDAAREVFAKGAQHTASFDLTACYDSLDHSVLRHFMEAIGLDPEFCSQLSKWLEVWTATGKGIFHNHGIPQGPLPSGLLSEVVLMHFDSLKLTNIDFHYFRYVDDIRLFANNEKDLRRLLVKLDLLSKDIGLFPQSAKIGIHKVTDIESELKSISNPPEPAIKNRLVNQKRLFRRVIQLTPHYSVSDPTRFKYLLAHAAPSAGLTSRIWRILDRHPELYKSACNYLRRYSIMPRVPAQKLTEVIRANTLYHSVQAEFIGVANQRLPLAEDELLATYLKRLWSPQTHHPDLLAMIGTYLVRTGHLTPNQIVNVCRHAQSWWTRATLINNLEVNYLAARTRERIVRGCIEDPARDVAIAAGRMAFAESVALPGGSRARWNTSGSILLREVGLISRNTATYCGVSKSFDKLVPRIQALNWRRLLGRHYSQSEKQVVELVALSTTNITAFVNALDVFNDLLLDALFSADGTIGGYTLGHIGGALGSSTSRFAVKFPSVFTLAKTVHDARYVSMYSHPRIGATGKPTKKIRFSFLGRAKAMLKAGTGELAAAGF